MPELKSYLPVETLALIEEMSKLTRSDGLPANDFMVKINRKEGYAGGMLQHICTVASATAGHIASPEYWLPRLLGGGTYSLHVYSPDKNTAMIGGPLFHTFREAPFTEPQYEVLKAGDYRGPTIITYPTRHAEGPPQPTPFEHMPFGRPGSLPGGVSPQPPQGSVPTFGSPGAPIHDPMLAGLQSQVASMQAMFAEMRAQSKEREMRSEYEDRIRRQEETHRREVDELKRSMRDLEVKASAIPGKSQLAELLAVMAPVVQQVLASQNELRVAMLGKDKDLSLENQKLLALQMQRPAVDPLLMALLEKGRAGEVPIQQMLGAVMEAMSGMTKQTVSLVSMLAELGTGGEENPWIAGVKEAVKGLQAIAQASTAAQRAALGAGRPLPPPVGAQPGVPALVPRPPTPVPVQSFTPAPGQGPRANGTTAPGLAGYTPEVGGAAAASAGPQTTAPQSVVDRLEQAVRQMAPPEQVAQLFVDAIEDPAMAAELDAPGIDGDPEKLMAKRLGAWVTEPDHRQYLIALLAEVDEQGRAAGIWDADDEEDEEPEDAAEVA